MHDKLEGYLNRGSEYNCKRKVFLNQEYFVFLANFRAFFTFDKINEFNDIEHFRKLPTGFGI